MCDWLSASASTSALKVVSRERTTDDCFLNEKLLINILLPSSLLYREPRATIETGGDP